MRRMMGLVAETGGRTASKDLGGALIDAAERVLVRDGLSGLTVRAVATEAGVAPMGVYNRFGSKDGLVAAVLVRGFDGLTAAMTGIRVGDPADRLMECGRSYRQFALSHPRHYEAMFGAALTTMDPEVAATSDVGTHADRSFDALVAEVVRSMDIGLVRRSDPTAVAQLIWSSVHGAVSLELAGVIKVDDPGESYERLLRLIADGLG